MDKSAEIAERLYNEQNEITTAMQELEGGEFRHSEWQHEGVGGGRTHIIEGGKVFERAAINVSLVRGAETPSAITEGHDRIDRSGKPFRATGLSMIVHPRNPYAPSFHANFRYFEVGEDEWWFGGGLDLTPMYGFDEDAVHFHTTLKSWCDQHAVADYPGWKKACDEYFYLKHRGEMRGVGGVFFDYLTTDAPELDEQAACVYQGAATIVPAYLPIVARRSLLPYGDAERQWQLLRRGRYVEFNLIYDRGTLFGLQTGVAIDSVLMSMPPMACWSYDVQPAEGSPERDVARFLQPTDWVGAEAADLH